MNKGTPVGNIVGASIYALTNDTGFTIDATTGRAYAGFGHYLVGGAIPGLTVGTDESAQSLIEKVEEWYKGVRALRGTEDILIGGWSYNGTLYLDLVTLVADLEDALTLGKVWGQTAIGNLDDDNYEETAVLV